MRLSVTLERIPARVRPRKGTRMRRSQAVQARVGYLLRSRSDPTQTARVGSEQAALVDQRLDQVTTASERRRKGYRSSWIEIMTLKLGEVKSKRRVGAVTSITGKSVLSGDRDSHRSEEYYKNRPGVVEWKRVYEESTGNSPTRIQLAQELEVEPPACLGTD